MNNDQPSAAPVPAPKEVERIEAILRRMVMEITCPPLKKPKESSIKTAAREIVSGAYLLDTPSGRHSYAEFRHNPATPAAALAMLNGLLTSFPGGCFLGEEALRTLRDFLASPTAAPMAPLCPKCRKPLAALEEVPADMPEWYIGRAYCPDPGCDGTNGLHAPPKATEAGDPQECWVLMEPDGTFSSNVINHPPSDPDRTPRGFRWVRMVQADAGGRDVARALLREMEVDFRVNGIVDITDERYARIKAVIEADAGGSGNDDGSSKPGGSLE